VQAQLLEVVKHLATGDFPERWSSVLPEALASLSSGDPSRVYGSLLVQRKIASSLEFGSGANSKLQVCQAALLCC
jgi:hypothetical protein